MPWGGPQFDGHVCSLGYEVLSWIHDYACHGPGDVQGDPLDLDVEMQDHIIECYRVHPISGQRLYDEAVLSRPKGRAKSEVAGLIVVAEAFGPVRFDGFGADHEPVGRPVRSPLIKCLATEESQAGNTFENAAFIAGEWGQDAHPDIYGGVTGARQYQSASVLYLPGGGEIRACTAGAASKDGGLETHVVADESHLYVLRELKAMYATVARNLGKRKIAEPWMHQTSTAYRPGEQSVFEDTMTSWRKGELSPRVYVNHREARGKIDLDDEEHTKRQLVYAFGDSVPWQDMDRKYRDMRDPRICPDVATAARYYLNRSMSGSDAWIALDVVKAQKIVDVVEPATPIALGFDGSLRDDATVLRGCRMSDGFLFTIGIWAKPSGIEGHSWEVPRTDVLAAVREAHERYIVARGFYDPHEWRSDIADLQTLYGERVIPWETWRDVQMAAALDRLHAGLMTGEIHHDGDPLAIEHYGNAYVRIKGQHRLVRKEHPQSSRKIDTVVADALATAARAGALADGWAPPTRGRVIVRR